MNEGKIGGWMSTVYTHLIIIINDHTKYDHSLSLLFFTIKFKMFIRPTGPNHK